MSVGKIRSDIRGEFEALVRPLMPLLYGAAFRLTRNSADASDVVQETCLRAYRTFANFTRGTNAKAWLLTILHSVYVNAYHRSKRESARFSFVGSDLDDAIAAESFARYTDGDLATRFGDCRSEIAAALDRLPDAFRLAVVLVDVDELSYEDVAALLDCPVGTVRSRLFRGRKLLCDVLRGSARQVGLLSVKPETES